MNKLLKISLVLGIILLSGCNIRIDKEANMCASDSDCKYVGFTGGCNTPEYVAVVMKKCQDKTGPCPQEATLQPQAACTCESNKCVAHDVIFNG
ncbi:MAG: hypothetical protein HGA85_04400 [Nanoarchaeota archaeon]|nr:hypothetical protein [Nanoarchaeota archaeon]